MTTIWTYITGPVSQLSKTRIWTDFFRENFIREMPFSCSFSTCLPTSNKGSSCCVTWQPTKLLLSDFIYTIVTQPRPHSIADLTEWRQWSTHCVVVLCILLATCATPRDNPGSIHMACSPISPAGQTFPKWALCRVHITRTQCCICPWLLVSWSLLVLVVYSLYA